MLVTKDQMDKLVKQINDGFARQERKLDELDSRLTKLEEKKKPGRPPKDGA